MTYLLLIPAVWLALAAVTAVVLGAMLAAGRREEALIRTYIPGGRS